MNAAEIARAVEAATTLLKVQAASSNPKIREGGTVGLLCRAVLDAEEVNRKYHELLSAVGNKYPDETRHQTALRYIQQFESQASIAAQLTEKGNG